jgi:hypothetical protein
MVNKNVFNFFLIHPWVMERKLLFLGEKFITKKILKNNYYKNIELK